MRVAITGGAGFIGGNLAAALRQRGDDVVVVDDLSAGARQNVPDGVELVVGSILDGDVLDGAFAGADAVVHLAARGSVPRSLADPAATNAANVTGTLEVLEAVRRAGGTAHVVVASSSSVYGSNPAIPKHEGLVPQPVSPYAVSKLATESYALSYQACFGVPVLAFRFFNVFGPLQPAGHTYAAVVPVFVDAALRGEPLPVHGDGLQTRDFTFVGSLVAVLVDALARKVTSPTPVNLAFGGRLSLLDVIGLLEDILGRSLEREHQPVRAGDVRDSQADQTSLRSLFPAIEPVDVRRGLEQTVEWFART